MVVLSFAAPSDLMGQAEERHVDLDVQVVATHELPCLYWCESATNGGWSGGVDLGVAAGLSPRVAVLLVLSHHGVRVRADGPTRVVQGFTLGLRAGGRSGPWAEGGGILHRRELRLTDGNGSVEDGFSDFGMGFHLAAGVNFGVVGSLLVSPALQLRRFTAGVPGRGDVTTAVLSAGVRVRIPLLGS